MFQFRCIIAVVLGAMTSAYATDIPKPQVESSASSSKSKPFDFYLLVTQWIPGWCTAGTGDSHADLDELHACQLQASKPLMYHGLWPMNNDANMPSYCSRPNALDFSKLTFENPYTNYLDNGVNFLNHEWRRHGTCSNYYTPGLETSSPRKYYKMINRYFNDSIYLYNQIQVSAFDLQSSAEAIPVLIHQLNPYIPAQSVIINCNQTADHSQILVGFSFCVNQAVDKFIDCPASVMAKFSCRGPLLTR